jgi:hypothetical protein
METKSTSNLKALEGVPVVIEADKTSKTSL